MSATSDANHTWDQCYLDYPVASLLQFQEIKYVVQTMLHGIYDAMIQWDILAVHDATVVACMTCAHMTEGTISTFLDSLWKSQQNVVDDGDDVILWCYLNIKTSFTSSMTSFKSYLMVQIPTYVTVPTPLCELETIIYQGIST